MAVVGPMARYVEDLELALDVLAPHVTPAEHRGRIAAWDDYFDASARLAGFEVDAAAWFERHLARPR